MAEVNVGRRIREAREALGLTQHEVARRLGLSQRAVSYVEKQQWVKQATLQRYADLLGLSLDSFLKPFGEPSQQAGLSRAEAIQQAFAVVCRDPEFGFGARPEEELSHETKRDIVRLYERYKSVRLLPDEVEGASG